MSTSWVIELPLAKNAGEAVLVNVTAKEGKPLDLDLLATDGESAFRGKGERLITSQVYVADVASEKPEARPAAAPQL